MKKEPRTRLCQRRFKSASASPLLLRQHIRRTGLAALGSTEFVQEGRQASAERGIPCFQFTEQTPGRRGERPTQLLLVEGADKGSHLL